MSKIRAKIGHPKSVGRNTQVKLNRPLAIFRFNGGEPYACNGVAMLSEAFDFNLDAYTEVMTEIMGGELKDGYYFADHQTGLGGYLETDDYDGMLLNLQKILNILNNPE